MERRVVKEVKWTGSACPARTIFPRPHAARLLMRHCLRVVAVSQNAVFMAAILVLVAPGLSNAQSGKPVSRNCMTAESNERQAVKAKLVEMHRLTDQYTDCWVAGKGGCQPIQDLLNEVHRKIRELNSRGHQKVMACFAAKAAERKRIKEKKDADRKRITKKKEAKQDGVKTTPIGKCESGSPGSTPVANQELRDPDKAAWEELKESVSDEALGRYIEHFVGVYGAPLLILKDVVAAYGDQVTKNALTSIRTSYADHDKKIIVLGIGHNNAWRNPDTARQWLRQTGGTIWIEDVKTSQGTSDKGVFWHPDPDFKTNKSPGKITMMPPRCTGDRPFGNQDIGPVLRE